MIEYDKREAFCYACAGCHRIEFDSKEDFDLAVRMLEAFQWAEANDVTVRRTHAGWRAGDDGRPTHGQSRLDAIENHRRKMEHSQIPEALGACKPKQAPKIKAGWYWMRRPGRMSIKVLQVKNDCVYTGRGPEDPDDFEFGPEVPEPSPLPKGAK